jgi:hypothetical protein
MTYRHLIHVFCVFLSLFVFGCFSKKQSFFEEYSVKENALPTAMHVSTEFPHTLEYPNISNSKLVAASIDETLMFYAEYYELDNPQPEDLNKIAKGNWKKLPNGTQIRKSTKKLNGQNWYETLFFFKNNEGKNQIFGCLLMTQEDDGKLKELMPKLF